jgi:hypothetical protein
MFRKKKDQPASEMAISNGCQKAVAIAVNIDPTDLGIADTLRRSALSSQIRPRVKRAITTFLLAIFA